MTFALITLAAPHAQAAVLPDVLTDQQVAPKTARWTISDIIEVSRIKSTAIQGASRVGAFIVQQPSLADGKNHYGLYEIDAARGGMPRKIAEADYMADLAWRPGTDDWTVRADFGAGVQLYTVKRSGHHQPLLVNADTALVGGSGGMLTDATEGPRQTGVVSYGWSGDGRRFWYSRLRHRDKASQRALLDSGLVFDDDKMGLSDPSVKRAITIASYELRVFDAADGSDRLVATSSARSVSAVFGGGDGSVAWVDASHLQYRQQSGDTGVTVWSLWRVDVRSGNTSQVHTASPDDVYYSTPTQAGYLTVHDQGQKSTLVEMALDGRLIKSYGEVNARRMAGGVVWGSPGDRFIFGTHPSDRLGLDAFPNGRLSKALEAIPDYLSACSFNIDLSFGLCSDESLTKAPELVSVSGVTGELTVIGRPNARYDAIAPLTTVSKIWTNRFGAKNTGYITYPRNYIPGHSYPAVIVTHGWGAQNYFARDGFQWEFPIQLMAEQGYFILSVNEPSWDPNVPAPYLAGGVEAGVKKQEFNQFLDPTASMEAAVEPLIRSGDVNPRAVGIAGYSHGAETTYFAISHSTVFSAASLGDDQGVIPSWFWIGVRTTRTWMKALYGGSPFDPAALDNYRKYSTSFRLNEVKAPLLQQFASTAGAAEALEVDQLFQDAGIPTELVDYPDESHVFYAPRHRESAMARNLDWFNYWLIDRRDPDSSKANQYARWEAMAARWRHSRQVTGSGGTAAAK